MNLKKFALRGMIILAVVIALSILFSGTIRTLTTPKVRYAPVKNGKFETVTELKGKVTFPEEEKFSLNLPEGRTLTVLSVSAAPGKKVRAGEKLLTAQVTDADKTLAALQQEYDTAQQTLDSWERKNAGLRLSQSETLWAEAWETSREAARAEQNARLEVSALIRPLGLDTIPDTLPEGADEKLTDAWSAWTAAKEKKESAAARLKELDRYAVADDTWTLLQQKKEAEDKRDNAEKDMMEIRMLMISAESITAPHDGYVASVSVDRNGVIAGDDVILTLTPEGVNPVIRVDISDIRQTVQKGTAVTVDSDNWGRTQTKVVSTGLSSTGHPYADAEITEDVIWSLGAVTEMIKKDEISLSLTSRAQESTCLIPASAVRGSGNSRYVFTGEQESSAFTGNRIIVRKNTVTVLAESADTVSIAEDMNYYKVLYMEDRPIEEGAAVMLYEE